MDLEQRTQLAARNTAEAIEQSEIEQMLQEKDQPTAYIGLAPTGTVHIGHFTTLRKVVDFVNAGFRVKILLADIHAELDIEKTPRELVSARTEYYKKAISAMIESAGLSTSEVEFVEGSSFQHSPEYQKGTMKIMEKTTVNRMKRAVNEVVRHSDSMKCSGLLYSAMQIMDCASAGLDVDVAYGGTDQRRIYMLGREVLPKIGESKPTCLFAPLLSGLSGGKMSASDESSKIGIHDDAETIEEKMNQAFCPAGQKEDNGVLEYVEYLIFPVLEERGEEFEIERPEDYGGDVSYSSFTNLEQDFMEEELHPKDLKQGASKHLAEIMRPVRQKFSDEQKLLSEAYPDEDVI